MDINVALLVWNIPFLLNPNDQINYKKTSINYFR